MRRRLLSSLAVLAVLSLMLCLATLVVWRISHHIVHTFAWNTSGGALPDFVRLR